MSLNILPSKISSELIQITLLSLSRSVTQNGCVHEYLAHQCVYNYLDARDAPRTACRMTTLLPGAGSCFSPRASPQPLGESRVLALPSVPNWRRVKVSNGTCVAVVVAWRVKAGRGAY